MAQVRFTRRLTTRDEKDTRWNLPLRGCARNTRNGLCLGHQHILVSAEEADVKLRGPGICVLSCCCAVFSTLSVLTAVGLGGVVVRGVSSDIGRVRRGQMFQQRLTIYDVTFNRLYVTITPTCGCALRRQTTFSVAPLSSVNFALPYRVRKGASGWQIRHAIVDYRVGSEREREIAQIRFLLR